MEKKQELVQLTDTIKDNIPIIAFDSEDASFLHYCILDMLDEVESECIVKDMLISNLQMQIKKLKAKNRKYKSQIKETLESRTPHTSNASLLNPIFNNN